MLYFLASNYYIKFSMLSNWISQLLLAILFASVTSFVAVAENGEQLFLENCAECHQADGKGLANIYPTLAGSEVVKGSGVDVALVLIIGRGEMPSFSGSISDEDIATIINYVRNAWGNSGDFISAKTINSLQK
ncbi:MAG: cytochrome c [Gammaproteobacteria bacterium]|nr:cytochrome c [Gammaproteobacteria bacterium]